MDLTQMQLNASIDESDLGQVRDVADRGKSIGPGRGQARFAGRHRSSPTGALVAVRRAGRLALPGPSAPSGFAAELGPAALGSRIRAISPVVEWSST